MKLNAEARMYQVNGRAVIEVKILDGKNGVLFRPLFYNDIYFSFLPVEERMVKIEIVDELVNF